jgi:hypothetical protein
MRMQSPHSLPLSLTTTTIFGLGMERKSPALGIINGQLKSYTNVRMSRTGTRIGGETPLPWNCRYLVSLSSKSARCQSIKVTEKHYSPWVKARQDQLEKAVRHTF